MDKGRRKIADKKQTNGRSSELLRPSHLDAKTMMDQSLIMMNSQKKLEGVVVKEID